jgi:drug/metabolite transporter (DMT)-like permease
MEKSAFKRFLSDYSIWGFAFGYFACYIPYSLLTKVMSKGLLPSLHGTSMDGFVILPVVAVATLLTMILVISLLGWWKYATHSTVFGLSLPHPTKWTFLSGCFTSLIIGTTTLAYTFESVSIVLAMLLMRGGVLITGPIVDAGTKRKIRWFSWAGFAGAGVSLLLNALDAKSFRLPFLLGLVILIYILSYFMRFQFMSRNAKSDKKEVNLRYFVEETMVSTPMLVIILAVFALLKGKIGADVRMGWAMHWDQPYLWALFLIGAMSQGTGFFGTLVFLDKHENTYCIPVNRASSVLAGVFASLLLALFPGQRLPAKMEFIGAGIMIVSILFLSIPPLLQTRKKRR